MLPLTCKHALSNNIPCCLPGFARIPHPLFEDLHPVLKWLQVCIPDRVRRMEAIAQDTTVEYSWIIPTETSDDGNRPGGVGVPHRHPSLGGRDLPIGSRGASQWIENVDCVINTQTWRSKIMYNHSCTRTPHKNEGYWSLVATEFH